MDIKRLCEKFGAAACDELHAEIALAEARQPRLIARGQALAAFTGGQFEAAPVKSFESGLVKAVRLDIAPHEIKDLNRGVLLFDTVPEVEKFRRIMMDVKQSRLARYPHSEEDSAWNDVRNNVPKIKDRYAVPTKNGLRGILLDYEIDYERSAEIQVHLSGYWAALASTHGHFKEITQITAEYDADNLPEDVQRLKSFLVESRKAYLAQIALETNANALLITQAGQVDCSWPQPVAA